MVVPFVLPRYESVNETTTSLLPTEGLAMCEMLFLKNVVFYPLWLQS